MKSDVIILGAGGAGLMCAIHATKRGRSVVLIDHATKIGGKILISGGGRCNFTNTGATHANYVSENPHFAKSALSRYLPSDFIAMVKEHGIAFHEKKLGQLFCDVSARDIVAMLESEVKKAGVELKLGCKIQSVAKVTEGFEVTTDRGAISCASLVVATGGLSIPKLGATGIGYDIAKQFNLKIVATRPALDGFTFTEADTPFYSQLSGLSADVTLSCNGTVFRENILFTHAGLSGPAALQSSLHWKEGDTVSIDFFPENDIFAELIEKKKQGNKGHVKNLLTEKLASRLAENLCAKWGLPDLPLPQVPEKKFEQFCQAIHGWKIIPLSTVGYSKAEVTRGGVDTNDLSSKTMEAKKVPGLFFIGEVVDVTGWLGGYNFQWAWASGWAAGQAV